MSNYPDVIIPADYHLKAISQTFHNFPPEILMNGLAHPMPYTIEGIASRAVKAAATAKIGMVNNVQMRIPEQEFAHEMKLYLGGFDNHVTDQLIRQVYGFIQYLIVRFEQMGWYNNADGESPYRFTGFTSPYSSTYDIVVKCG